ncbi:hypothetical protein [Micromonospora sp. WMMD1082]|uniref:hypothetical protein n=1 Tax=Micromonospora sp. WMMD1082 TaxID=3016104 RepID=UPI0024165F79|nr:hypothetical protein [Micromonospora sp. WMMD1082]MDG4793651.1 hypothetical protein [Micromonospora sp. WMMD1082]
MTEPTRHPAPEAVGDIIPGEPPVPITVWHAPAPQAGDTMSVMLADRLVRNFTRRRWLVLDLTSGEQLARAVRAAQRHHARHTPQNVTVGIRRAALIVTGWPLGDTAPVPFLADCAQRVMVGGCVAVVLQAAELTVNQVLIAAARAAGLTYLQHIVAAHDLTAPSGQLDGGTHLPVHSDVLIFRSSLDALRGSTDG